MGAIIPVLLLVALAILSPAWSANARVWTTAMVVGFSVILSNYLWWRLTETVMPARGFSLGSIFVWVVFLAELWLWFETIQLVVILLRRTNRSMEADVHEARLSSVPPDTLPTVDVFIASYNEPLDVLEKTIAGALSLDWPAERLHVHLLDDGRREWLRDYCIERGVNHLTRGDNFHAKAGNINAALKRTSSELILVLDADFVPQRRILMRAVGFFNDPKIGIVQMPHHFFNHSPLQTNLDMRASLPDEQRFFFDVIQPGRDGWNCAFCCGSNGIIRRAAMERIGGEMPTDSVTEDMLLTLVLLRKGFITRYLGERLAIGLAPETLDAYFVQRARWAQGAVQLLYTPKGPLGPGLRPIERLFFNPSHWLSQSICQPLAMATPAIFLLTGIPPLMNASLEDILLFQVPSIISAMLLVQFLAPREFAPVSSTVESVLQSFRLMPVVLLTLVKPHGHDFKVTPKGSDAGLSREDRYTILVALGLIFATGVGLFLNVNFATRIVGAGELLPVVAFWAVVNMIVLLMVITVAVPRPVFRKEERFDLTEPCRIHTADGQIGAEVVNMSLTGILIVPDGNFKPEEGTTWVGVELSEAGIVPGLVRRVAKFGNDDAIGVEFSLPSGRLRDAVICKLFTNMSLQPPVKTVSSPTITMLSRIFRAKNQMFALPESHGDDITPPGWLDSVIKASNEQQIPTRQLAS